MVSLDSIIGEMSYTSMAVWPRIRVGVGVGVAIHWTGLGAVFVPTIHRGCDTSGDDKKYRKANGYADGHVWNDWNPVNLI